MSDDRPLLARITEYATRENLTLPVFNEAASKLRSVASEDAYDIGEVERIIQSDQTLAAGVLRAANSPFFGGLTQITTVRSGVVRLGIGQVVRLVTLAAEKSRYSAKQPLVASMLNELWRHASACALASEWLARRLGFAQQQEEAFVGGLMHDIGKLFLLRVLDEMMSNSREPLEVAPQLVHELLDSAHTEQGHRLVTEWNLPEVYRAIVRDHHGDEFDPSNVPLMIVRVSNAACRRLGVGLHSDPSMVLSALPEAHHLNASEVMLAELEIILEDELSLV